LLLWQHNSRPVVQQCLASMSRFKADIKALEAQLRRQQRLLQEVQDENEQCKQKESALLSTLLTLQCRMSALASAGNTTHSSLEHSGHSGSLSGATWGAASEGSTPSAGQQNSRDQMGPDSSPGHSSGLHYVSGVEVAGAATGTSPHSQQEQEQQQQQQQQQAAGACGAVSGSVCAPASPSSATPAEQAQQDTARSTAERSALDLARMQQQLQALDALLQVDMQEVRGSGGGGVCVCVRVCVCVGGGVSEPRGGGQVDLQEVNVCEGVSSTVPAAA
jgi:hypothetical protein